MDSFERDLAVATKGLAPEAIAAALAAAAKAALADAQAAGELPPDVARFVNGPAGLVEGMPEESVVPPGPIVYVADWLPAAAAYALEFARARSPVRSGRYRDSWFLMVGGARVEQPPPDATEVVLTNDQPYSRKIELGAIQTSVPPGVVEDTAAAVLDRFGGAVDAERQFVTLASGYRLHGTHRHRRGGEEAYPALVLTLAG